MAVVPGVCGSPAAAPQSNNARRGVLKSGPSGTNGEPGSPEVPPRTCARSVAGQSVPGPGKGARAGALAVWLGAAGPQPECELSISSAGKRRQ